MRGRIIEFLIWTLICIIFGGLIYTLVYFKIQENKENESEKPEKGWVILEDPDTVELVIIKNK